MDRSIVSTSGKWSPVQGKALFGIIHRVVLRSVPTFVDGLLVVSEASGRDVGNVGTSERQPRLSVAVQSRASSPTRRTTFADVTSPTRPRVGSEIDVAKLPEVKGVLSTFSIASTPAFLKKHIVSVKAFDRKDLHALFGVAQEMRTLVEKFGKIDMLHGKVMCSAFWEPSTRTSCSFETAMTRLGGSVVSINQITSSIAKGESLGDTGNFYFNNLSPHSGQLWRCDSNETSREG
jgi:carbamoyl-phosphate synthase/aspartate carbamoyltransferase